MSLSVAHLYKQKEYSRCAFGSYTYSFGALNLEIYVLHSMQAEHTALARQKIGRLREKARMACAKYASCDIFCASGKTDHAVEDTNFVSGSKDGYVVGDISWYVWLLELWKRRLSSTSKIYENLVEGYIHVHLHPTGSVFYFPIEDMYGIVNHVIIYMLLPHVRQCSKIRGFFTSA